MYAFSFSEKFSLANCKSPFQHRPAENVTQRYCRRKFAHRRDRGQRRLLSPQIVSDETRECSSDYFTNPRFEPLHHLDAPYCITSRITLSLSRRGLTAAFQIKQEPLAGRGQVGGVG